MSQRFSSRSQSQKSKEEDINSQKTRMAPNISQKISMSSDTVLTSPIVAGSVVSVDENAMGVNAMVVVVVVSN